ncbi:putative nuclease HARBI1 [Diadema setosum]|uniref:putative nuclease HARBI1 n=1 Tax=Diadema setosum TaxID=31175 RepID=UPI003B3AE59F
MDRRELAKIYLALQTLEDVELRTAYLVARYLDVTNHRKPRTVWVRNWLTLRPEHGAYSQLLDMLRLEDVVSFKNFLRLSPELFAEMRDRLTPRLRKYDTWWRKSLEVGLKLAITLRYVATGDSYHSLMYMFYVPHNSISIIVREVCTAICEEYGDETISNPTTPEEWKEIANRFGARWNFHNTIGALDGKHIRIRCPPNSGSEYFNYKGFFSVALLALVDADYRFRWVDIGAPGAASDAQIWNRSTLKEAVDDENLGLPKPQPLPGTDRPVPYFIIADSAFALKTTLMKPFCARELSHEERIFNSRLSRARRVVEDAHGILASRFRCMLTQMLQRPETVTNIVMACVILHNILRQRIPGEQNQLLDREDAQRNIIPGEWRQDTNMQDMEQRLVGNHTTRVAKLQRMYLKEYYDTVGAVGWQNRMVEL